jgi:hypothetical protein
MNVLRSLAVDYRECHGETTGRPVAPGMYVPRAEGRSIERPYDATHPGTTSIGE